MMIINRNIFIIMSLSLLLFSCNETAASKIKADSKSNSDLQPSYAEITFDKISHDFGNVNEGEIAKTIFTFTNTGENDLNEYLQEHYVFTGEQLNKKLELVEIKDNLQDHLVFDHSYTDYITSSITFLNLALIIYLFYKLNTNKTR